MNTVFDLITATAKIQTIDGLEEKPYAAALAEIDREIANATPKTYAECETAVTDPEIMGAKVRPRFGARVVLAEPGGALLLRLWGPENCSDAEVVLTPALFRELREFVERSGFLTAQIQEPAVLVYEGGIDDDEEQGDREAAAQILSAVAECIVSFREACNYSAISACSLGGSPPSTVDRDRRNGLSRIRFVDAPTAQEVSGRWPAPAGIAAK